MNLKDLQHLSKKEKIKLVEDLWDNIADESHMISISAPLKKTLNERLTIAITTNERKSWEEIKTNIRRKSKK